MKQLLSLLAFAFVLTLSGYAHAQAPQNPEGPTDPLTIVTADGKSHAFKVEMADTPEESERGLMYRASMPKDHGMIFDFKPAREVSMWMKNCLFPQDMLFLDEKGKVLAIAENARPGSTRLISPGFPIASVLELNGGMAKELGLKPGDKVQHKLFGNG
ncbi:MAG TPA: DUF192 domain-containing protein [Hyphomonadaceae bacterium]|nr:DUF192 domain-containing protein [Hyphomonadaceae bacterium]